MDMDTIRLDSVYVPTLKDPLVLMTPRERPLRTLAKPCLSVVDRVLRKAAEFKTTAVVVTAAVVTKLISLGKSFMKYLKKDFMKKEGVPLKGLVIYKGATKGIGRFVKGAI